MKLKAWLRLVRLPPVPTTGLVGLLIISVAIMGGYWFVTDRQPVVVTISEANHLVSGPVAPAFTLQIPSLKLTVPIIAKVSATDESAYLLALERGVAQSDSSVNPDQDGNLFIFGHSDYYKNKPGAYKQVFRPLNQLKQGDLLSIVFQQKTYQYQVVKSSVVADDDWSITRPTVAGTNRTLTLMTCWPPGTLDKRYAVIAKQLTED